MDPNTDNSSSSSATTSDDSSGSLPNFDMASAVKELEQGLGLDKYDDETLEVKKPAAAKESGEDLEDEGGDDGEAAAAAKQTPEEISAAAAAKKAEDEAAAAAKSGTPVKPDLTQPPKSWRAESSKAWALIPPIVQEEIHKREQDILQGIESYKEEAGVGKTFKSLLAPYDPLLKQHNIDPVKTVENLLRTHHSLATSTPEIRKGLLLQIAKSYGVDLTPTKAPSSDDDSGWPADPEIEGLRGTVNELKSRLEAQETERSQAALQAAQADVKTFFADPGNHYAEELRADMQRLLRSGEAANLRDAYDKAVWLNPVTRSKEVQRKADEAAAEARKAAEEQQKAAAKVNAAKVSATPKHGKPTATVGSMEETLNQVYDDIMSKA